MVANNVNSGLIEKYGFQNRPFKVEIVGRKNTRVMRLTDIKAIVKDVIKVDLNKNVSHLAFDQDVIEVDVTPHGDTTLFVRVVADYVNFDFQLNYFEDRIISMAMAETRE